MKNEKVKIAIWCGKAMIKYYQVAGKEMKDVKSCQHVSTAAATKYHQLMKDQK